MLRRRKKGPREDVRAPQGQGQGHAAQRSRRRARPGAIVPPELKLDPSQAQAVTTAAQPRAKAPVAAHAKLPTPAKKSSPPQPAPHVPKPKHEPAPASAQHAQAPRPPGPGEKRRRAQGEVILVTGFEPFGGEATNPSWEICERLPREIAGARVETCLVPCVFRRAIEVVADAIERHRPAIVLCLGQAGGRSVMGVERVAINVDDARIPDNDGQQPVDEPVAPDGPAAHFATLPLKAMAQAMRRAGAPAEVSNTAGTFVCNHLMYGVLHFIQARGFGARAGFIHVPYADEQVLEKPPVASMALATMVKGVEAALHAARHARQDIRQAEGRLD